MSQVDGISDMAPAYGGNIQKKEQWFLHAVLSGRKLSPALILMPDTSVPPCIPLLPFKLELRGSESEYVSPCVRVL